MTPTKYPPRTAAAMAAASARTISNTIAATLKAITAYEETIPDGYPTQTIGAAPPEGVRHEVKLDENGESVDGPSTAVERAALHARRTRASDRDTLTMHLNEAVRHLGSVEKIMSREQYRPVKPAQCDCGVGREGQVEWSNPLCKQFPSEGRRTCDDCLNAEDIWRVKNGLERREREPAHHSTFQPRAAGRFVA